MVQMVLAPLALIPMSVFLVALLIASVVSIFRPVGLWLAIVLCVAFALSPYPQVVLAATGIWFFIEVAALLASSVLIAISLGEGFKDEESDKGERTQTTILQVAAYLVAICAFFGTLFYTFGFFHWLEGRGITSFSMQATVFGVTMAVIIIIGLFSAHKKTVDHARKRVPRRNEARFNWLKCLRDQKKDPGLSGVYDKVWSQELTAAQREEVAALPKSDADLRNFQLKELRDPWLRFVEKHGERYETLGTSIQEHVDVTSLYVAWTFNWPFRLINYILGDFIRDAFEKIIDNPLRAIARRGVEKQFQGTQ